MTMSSQARELGAMRVIKEYIDEVPGRILNMYPVVAVDGSEVTIEVEGSPRAALTGRNIDVRPGDIAVVCSIDREMIVLAAIGS